MLNGLEDRRHTTRLAVKGDSELTLRRPHAVRLVEISMTGALVRTTLDLPVGQRVELQTRLGDHQFAADVEVRRTVPPGPEESGVYTLGVSFIALDADNRRCLERFLKQPPPR